MVSAEIDVELETEMETEMRIDMGVERTESKGRGKGKREKPSGQQTSPGSWETALCAQLQIFSGNSLMAPS